MVDIEPEDLSASANRNRVLYTFSPDLRECENVTSAFAQQGYRATFAQTIPALSRLFDIRRPDVALVDYESGVAEDDVLALIRDLSFGVRVFVIGNANMASDMVVRAIRAGAVALFERPLALTEMTHVVAIDLRRSCSSEKNPARCGSLSALSVREIDVLRYVMEGQSNKEVGLQLHISARTVEAHRASSMKKLGARNTAEMVHIAMMDR
ncbi:MAG: response regulator transcription factor [Devosia sp.]